MDVICVRLVRLRVAKRLLLSESRYLISCAGSKHKVGPHVDGSWRFIVRIVHYFQRSVQGLQPVVTQNQQLQFTVPVVTCRTWTSRQEEGREWEGDEGESGRGR
jgi:hypothetical protein